MTKVVMNAEEIDAALERMAAEICEKPGDGPWAVVGIRRGGENLARRLVGLMSKHSGKEPPLGFVDITLYRDDGFGPHDWPTIGQTRIDFELKAHTVVLVDDVLYTGRTVRAAIDALLDYGRPRALRLATLVDRGLRELPFQADAVGLTLDTDVSQRVDVAAGAEANPEDSVILRPMKEGAA